MKKVNQKYLIVIIFLFSILIINYSLTYAGNSNNLLGRVVYSDNNCPVTEGNIRIYNTSVFASDNILETTVINSNGEFNISGQIVYMTDNIKLMAYPNDLTHDRNFQFEPYVLDIDKALKNSENQYSIVIKVRRSPNSQSEVEKYGGINLKQNFPNPFNPTTSISFDLPNTSRVTLKIYNMRGETVETLIDNKLLSTGANEIEFNAGNLTSGIYIYSLKAGGFTLNRKMILLK